MALSDAQKNRILRLLCYPHGTLVTTSLDYSKIISDRLSNLSSAAQVEVEELMEWIERTDEQLKNAINSAGVKRIDDIEFFGASEGTKSDELRKQKRRYVSDLSSILGIPSQCSGGAMGRVCV